MDKRVLLYRRGGLGDTLLVFPIAEILKRKGFKVHIVGNTDYLHLAVEAGFADKTFSEIPPDPADYDRIILFSFENFLKTPNVEVIPPFPTRREHILRHYLKSLCFENETFSGTLPLEEDPEWNGHLIIHPGSGSPKKNAPPELFLEVYRLAEAKGLNPLFVLGEAEESLSKILSDYRTYRVENILLFAKKLKGAAAFLGNDSGFTHLASYLGVPTLALFGPTDPAIWKPIGLKTLILYKELKCSPCFPSDCKTTPPKRCLEFQPIEIMEKVELLFQQNNAALRAG